MFPIQTQMIMLTYVLRILYYDIPARMNVGFLTDVSGITEEGIFHSWCEYYDEIEKEWVELDPYLEDYKEVELYRNSLRDHIKIITRGKSSVSPKLAFYTENDFLAESASEEISPIIDFDLSVEFDENKTTSQYLQGNIYIRNTGNVPITGYEILSENIPVAENIDLISNEETMLLLPGESISITFNIPIQEVNYTKDMKAEIVLKCTSESGYSLEQSTEAKIILSVPILINILSYLISLSSLAVVLFLIYFGYRNIRK